MPVVQWRKLCGAAPCGLILEVTHSHLKVRALPKTEKQQARARARGSVERVEGRGLPAGQATAGALDDRGLGGRREAPLSPIVRQTKHKATQTKWLHCTCFSQKLAHGANRLPRGSGLIELSLHYENCKGEREVLCEDN